MGDENKEKSPVIARFFSNTSFAGFREAYESQSICWKVLWASSILLCAGLTIYQLYGLIDNYVDQPTNTLIKTMKTDYKLPQVVFAYDHSFALNFTEKARILGEDKQGNESFEFLKSFFYEGAHRSPGDPFNISKARSHLTHVMQKHNYSSVAQLYKAMFITDDLPITDVITGSVKIDKVRGHNGVMFYLVSFNGSDVKRGHAKIVTLSYESGYKGTVKAFLSPYDDDEVIDIVQFTSIEYKLSKTIKLSTPTHPCRPDKEKDFTYNVDVCKQECAQRRWRELHPEYPCTPWEQSLWYEAVTEDDTVVCSAGIKFGNDNKTVWGAGMMNGYYNGTMENTVREMSNSLLSLCNSTCVPSCEQLIINTAITRTATFYEEDPNVRIEYPNAALILVLEESYSFGWESFLGNVGGILGLWLGANLLTILQAIYLFMGDRDLVEKNKLDKLAALVKSDVQELQRKSDATKEPSRKQSVKQYAQPD